MARACSSGPAEQGGAGLMSFAAAGREPDGVAGPVTGRGAGSGVVHRQRHRDEVCRRHLIVDGDRRPLRLRRRDRIGVEEADHLQRRAVRQALDERAGGDLVPELRRQEDAGLDPEAAGLRRVEEVPADPADPRRAARRLRPHLLARVPVDGRPRLRGALHQPARQLELRAGVRQRHPVRLSRRRLQGPDGRRGRGREDAATSTNRAWG